MTKYIFVTGGVVSSLGKGLTSAAIGMILEQSGFTVSMQKLDPYINVDPGTMSPFQHGEVYVTDDGAETDLDLGHYERFTNAVLSKDSNYTTGKIYESVIRKERRGDYLGRTVQVIPHITDEIKQAIHRGAKSRPDVAITEVGGTVGDIESIAFLEAIRQFALDEGFGNVLFVHLTLLPYLRASGEMKTKPTQQSVGKLREIGIQPHVLICRTEQRMTSDMRDKISLFCNVPRDAVLEEKDVDHSIYEVPLNLVEEGLERLVFERLSLKPQRQSDWSQWRGLVEILRRPEQEVEVALVGKYIQLTDAYKSIYEALTHGGLANRAVVKIRRVAAESLVDGNPAGELEGVDGVLIPGGFGERGFEGKIRATRYCREQGVPMFGICYGMQAAAVEYARNVLGIAEATTTEYVPDAAEPVIDLMEEQKKVHDLGGTMRLGSNPCALAEGTVAARAYGELLIHERHRHRFELNNAYRERLQAAGLVLSGVNEELDLVEVIELSDHPFYVGVQYHPEFKSRPLAPHPLFREFIRAACEHRRVRLRSEPRTTPVRPSAEARHATKGA